MATVVPTVLATTPEDYATRLERAASLSPRIHVDICDGRFADAVTIGLAQVHAPDGVQLDLHLMLEDPAAQLETALSLKPSLIIFHAESKGDLAKLIEGAKSFGVRVGLAILPRTTVSSAVQLISQADHVLIFTGTLGHNGGEFQADQLPKIAEVRAIKPGLEVSVDGGVTDETAAEAVRAGADVLYVGAFVQSATNPKAAWARLGAVI